MSSATATTSQGLPPNMKTDKARPRYRAPNRGRGKNYQWLVEHSTYQGDDCLKWPFFIDPLHGRGRVGYLGKIWWAHRLMCVIAHGEPPTPKHEAAHSCGNGNKGCINPRHLSWKTASENCLDRSRHGRGVTNDKGRYSCRLTQEQIEFIRAAKGKVPLRELADRFGMSLPNIRYWQGYRDKLMARQRQTALSRTLGGPA